MNGSNPTNHNRLVGWTFLFLILAVGIFFYGFLKRSSPVPSEEMQLRQAEQRAHQRSDSD